MPHRDVLHHVLVATAILALVAACSGTAPGSPTTSGETPSPPADPTTPSPGAAARSGTPSSGPPTAPSLPPGAASLPVRATAYAGNVPATAPASDGGLYVAVPGACEEPDDPCTVTFIALDGSGGMRPGWPVAVHEDAECELGVAIDDSLRAVCGPTAHAYDLRGQRLAGWPVRIGVDSNGTPFAVAGRELRVELDGAWLSVGPDGSVAWRTGALPGVGLTASIDRMPDGQEEPEPGDPARLTLSDEHGILSGWPVEVPFGTSEPVVGPDGTVYLVVQGTGSAQLLLIDRSGKRLDSRTATIADTVPHVGSWADPYIPRSPILGSDGSVWVVAQTSAYAWDPRGRLRPGWPFSMTVPLGLEGYCGEPCTVDCYPDETVPFVDQAGTLYLLRAPVNERTGGSVLAVGLDGKPVPGWPVQLKRAGAEPWYGSVGPDGTVFVEVYEPEPAVPQKDECYPSASETTLALRRDGTVRYRVTLVDP